MAKSVKAQKYPVLEVFRDKETKRKYVVGSEYETEDVDRASYLQEFGYLGQPVEEGQKPDVLTDAAPLQDTSETTEPEKKKSKKEATPAPAEKQE